MQSATVFEYQQLDIELSPPVVNDQRNRGAMPMSSSRFAAAAVALFVSSIISGCGLAVPEMRVAAEDPRETPLYVNDLVNTIQCELAQSTKAVMAQYSGVKVNSLAWLEDWSAKVTLKLIVYEKSSLTPSIIFTNKLVDTSSIFGFGAEFSSSATRTETVDFFWIVKDLISRDWPYDCGAIKGFPTVGNFKLFRWLDETVTIAVTPGTISRPFKTGGPLDSVQNEIQFVVNAAGSVSPSWTLNVVSVNSGEPLFGAQRMKTNYLLITMGPLDELKSGRPRASEPVQLLHSAALFGQAVGANLSSR